MKKIRVVELFAGVGGFRLGLEQAGKYEIVWSNQWEPSSKAQHASDIYVEQFGPQGHSNDDIESVSTDNIPDHDLLCGGFPCQDYSVASTLKNSKGLIGKKGVLWWSIHRILDEKKNKPQMLLLENVDRLLVSPAKQKGRDFAVMLKSLDDLGYAVEWRVINAADYGMPQRRRRVFFLGYLKGSKIYNQFNQALEERDKRGHFAEITFIGLKSADIKDYKKSENLLQVTVDFVGEVITCVKDREKKIISGDPEKIKKIYDTWVFSRDMRSGNPNWQLVDTLT